MELKNHLLALTVGAALAGSPGWLEAEPGRPRSLQVDAGYPVTALPTSGPEFRVRDFAVAGDRIFYTERTAPGQPHEHYVRELRTGQPPTSSIAIQACELYSLSIADSKLMFFDFAEGELASYDIVSGRLEHLSATPGYRSLGTFANGKIIATLEASGLLHEHGALSEDEIKTMLEIMTKEEFREEILRRHQRAAELGVYDTILLGPDLRVEKPLLYAFEHTKIGGIGSAVRDPLQRALASRIVRMSSDRSLAAVFSIDRPGITLFDQNGELLGEIESPGRGKILPPGNPYEGEHVLFQSDVVVNRDHLLVVDNPGRRLWALGLDGRRIASFEEPFVVLEAERVGPYLYVRGCSRPHPGPAECILEGRFARYYYPELPEASRNPLADTGPTEGGRSK